MRTSVKVGLVATGYVGAFVIASLVVVIHVALTSGPAYQASSGMLAFGDAILFLAVLAVASLPSTGAALFFLRPHRAFWRTLSIAALVVAATGLAALIGFLVDRSAGAASSLSWWFALAPVRLLVAPLLALVFLLAGLFAPNRPARIALLAAILIEGAIFAGAVLIWLRA